MLPKFPKFKILELSDKADIEKITNKFPPYSDFNFVSMWCWDIKGEMRISKLYDNLVIRFTDYLTGEAFYSFLGDSKINNTINALLNISVEQKLESSLKLVPSDSIAGIDKSFSADEDKDNFDYIYDLNLMNHYKGNLLEHHRRSSNKFIKFSKSIELKVLNISQEDTQNNIIDMFDEWVDNKAFAGKDVDSENERKAMFRFFEAANRSSMITSIGIFDSGNMIGFAINELLHSGFAINHFIKADIGKYQTIFSYLMQENARFLMKHNKYYLNFEQDLGLPGLRQSKRSFRPVYFLKKYKVDFCSL